MTDAVKTLSREIRRAKGVKSGTVVTFTRTIEFVEGIRRDEHVTRTFDYAAIFVGGRWFFTGKGGLGQSALTNREFLDRMAEPDISRVRVATNFERVS